MMGENIDNIENAIVKIYFKDGIIYASYTPKLDIDLETAKKTSMYRKEISKKVGAVPVLADIRNLGKVSDEARDWLGTKEANELIPAMAILTNNPIQNLLANFYLKFSNPPMPTRLFTNEEKALRWLKLYLQRN